MITYLYGTDKYRIKQYLAQHAPGAMVGEEALKTQGLFDQTPVILFDPPKNLYIPKDVEVFVVSEKKIKQGIEFKPLQGADVKNWIQQELKQKEYTITPDALTLLTERYVDSWQTSLELTKLCNYAFASKRIERQDVELLGTVDTEENIFRLTDAIANRNKAEAVLLLDRQLANGADPYYLFSMIIMQFRNMLAPNRTGIHPYAAQKARSAAKSFTMPLLKNAYQYLHQLELDTKNGIRDMEEGLFQFIFAL